MELLYTNWTDEDTNNKETVMAGIQQDGTALRYASRDLQADPEVVLAAVRQDPMALWYASETLLDDSEFMAVAYAIQREVAKEIKK